MKTGVTMVGVILMVLGGMLAVTILFTPYSIDGTVGVTILPFGGMIMGVVGFLTFLVGLAAPETEKPPTRTKETKQTSTSQTTSSVTEKVVTICPQCKNRIPTTVKFCPECGEDLRPKTT